MGEQIDTTLVKREVRMRDGIADLRGDLTRAGLVVLLRGGPFGGHMALVDHGAKYAWIAGDFSYDVQQDGSWKWTYDSYA